ncbi:transmembrane protein 134 isoform X2 [Mustela lutreola]|uniref:transmembrane protein 134 isoform X2 n=1 Tax=Mustela lutreola TaxID=9666 RepID=UPI0027971AAB|nr:transmembrane protein 134 isoform X2 [Mustela lutreola]
MSAARPQFSIDDAFELSLEDAGPGPEFSGVSRFGPLHFERRARFEVADEDKQSRLRYQNLENDEDGAQASPEPDGGVSTSSQWSFSTISNTTQRSYHACCSWTQHPLIQKNRRVVLASFLLLLLGLGSRRVTTLPFILCLLGARCSVGLFPPLWKSHSSADPDRRGTGGGPLARCLQRHLLRAGFPVVGSRSLPRDLHLLRGQGPPGLSVLLPALLREVNRGRAAGIQPRLRAAPGGAPRVRSCSLISREEMRDPGAPNPSKFAQEVCPIPRPGKVAPGLFCALTYSWALGLLGWWCFVLIKECTSFQKRPLILLSR